jgi:hypothetical protein
VGAHADLPGHTFAADNPLTRAGEVALELGRRIDYVLVRCGMHGPSLDILDCRLLLDAAVNGVWAKRPLRGAGRVGRPDSSARSLDPAWLCRRVGDSVTTPIVR